MSEVKRGASDADLPGNWTVKDIQAEYARLVKNNKKYIKKLVNKHSILVQFTILYEFPA